MLQGIESIFENRQIMLKHLKKKNYEEYTDAFIKNYGHYFQEMLEHVEQADDKKAAAEEIGNCLVKAVQTHLSGKNGKMNGRVQADLNFFMIYYVFPTILGLESEYSKVIADGICDQWGKSFKDSQIKYTDYATLHGSFRNKIFGIF